MTSPEKKCTVCGGSLDRNGSEPGFVEAGKWLAENHWFDDTSICCLCLENRGRLAMMYLNETEF